MMNFLKQLFSRSKTTLFTGAIVTPKDEQVEDLGNVAFDTAPFDWNTGYDVRDELLHSAKVGDLTTKDQGGSFSCGGQATGYLTEVLEILQNKTYTEKSAKDIYSQSYAPNGGSSDFSLMQTILNRGVSDELLVPSYESNLPPSEEFMRDRSKISSVAKVVAQYAQGAFPVYVKLDFDSLAKATRDYHGVIIGIYGKDNGTWLSARPLPPKSKSGAWAHWVYLGIVKIENGKKVLGFKNSWGDIGENGWQYITEDYAPYIFASFTFVTKPVTKKIPFVSTLKLGSQGDEVKLLQVTLKEMGLFPTNQVPTGYFGNVSKEAVNKFQLAYKDEILIPAGLTQPTGIVGTGSRNKLNNLINK